MTLEEEVVAPRAENALLRTENALLRVELAAAQARIAELEQRTTPLPGFVQATTERQEREVATHLLGDFDGHLVSDFYGGYNAYGGKHQRCWVHLPRDLHDLKKAQADDADVIAWAQDVRARSDEAQAALAGPTPLTQPRREQLYRPLEDRAHVLGLAHARVANKEHPGHALCHRLLRHQGDLFQFVRVPGLSAANNAAERMRRPRVLTRTISGGSRSPRPHGHPSGLVHPLRHLEGPWPQHRPRLPLSTALCFASNLNSSFTRN